MPNKRGVQNKRESQRFFLNLINGESKQTGAGGGGISKNPLIIIYFRVLQKSRVILLNKNIKLKEKHYINKKTHLATEKKFDTSSFLGN